MSTRTPAFAVVRIDFDYEGKYPGVAYRRRDVSVQKVSTDETYVNTEVTRLNNESGTEKYYYIVLPTVIVGSVIGSEKHKPVMCHCGLPLHYTSQESKAYVERMVAALGEYIKVTVGDRTWMVQRHYFALHGLKGSELPSLGFQEVGP